MIFENAEELRERIEAAIGRPMRRSPQICEDTSNYMHITTGTVLRLDGNDYYVTGEAKEGRFGITEQPKFWVKYAYDLTTGRHKVLKLVFHEQYVVELGPFTVRCHRDPDKESAVLDLVSGDSRFMQGHTVLDPSGNNVRIIDVIRGRSLYNAVQTIEQNHEEYFHTSLPGILERLLGAIEALGRLQDHDLQHGDVRNDHIIVESGTGEFRWIDFDFKVNFLDFDMWSVGNLLTFAVGKGIRTYRDAVERKRSIEPDDAMLFYQYRLANLRKVFPYVPHELNDVLLRFSAGTTEYYEDIGDVVRDVRSVLDALGWSGSVLDQDG